MTKLEEFNKLSDEEKKVILKALEHKDYNDKTEAKISFNEPHVKFGVISDTHIGHKNYQPRIMDNAAKYFKKQNVEFVLHAGDICEGMSGRDGHCYELSHLGATEQSKYAVEELSKLQKPIYAITSTGSHDGWFSSKGNIGYELGPDLENRLKDFHFLGYDEADVKLDNGLGIRLVHPGDGIAYALSYKLQRYINSLSGGQKPNILFEGHYHKSIYMLYRNIHAFEAGTLESQTIFMKKKGTPAMMGYWVIDAAVGKQGGVDRIKNEFVSFYE